jgi:nitroimidazol reductase NimA-like FMN-containing flavoprotein (pyridoxamine 5'-phosphate oxidase superfamily)
MPMNYVYSESNKILMTTFSKSQKVRNLQRDPKATLLIESGKNYKELKSVIFYADAEIVSDHEEVRKVTELLLAMETASSESMREQALSSVHKKVLLRFAPDSCISWDHGKLNDQY